VSFSKLFSAKKGHNSQHAQKTVSQVVSDSTCLFDQGNYSPHAQETVSQVVSKFLNSCLNSERIISCLNSERIISNQKYMCRLGFLDLV
jgi:hypothetical protein